MDNLLFDNELYVLIIEESTFFIAKSSICAAVASTEEIKCVAKITTVEFFSMNKNCRT